MLLIAMIIEFSLYALLNVRRSLPEGNSGFIESSDKPVKATIDGKPVKSYIMDD